MAQSSRKKTMKALSFLLVSLLFIPLLQTEMAYPHVFYVSITRVKWDLSRTVLDISVRIFTDDLEEAILADQTRRLSLLRAKKKLNREDFVKDYIESRLAFQINGTPGILFILIWSMSLTLHLSYYRLITSIKLTLLKLKIAF